MSAQRVFGSSGSALMFTCQVPLYSTTIPLLKPNLVILFKAFCFGVLWKLGGALRPGTQAAMVRARSGQEGAPKSAPDPSYSPSAVAWKSFDADKLSTAPGAFRTYMLKCFQVLPTSSIILRNRKRIVYSHISFVFLALLMQELGCFSCRFDRGFVRFGSGSRAFGLGKCFMCQTGTALLMVPGLGSTGNCHTRLLRVACIQ